MLGYLYLMKVEKTFGELVAVYSKQLVMHEKMPD